MHRMAKPSRFDSFVISMYNSSTVKNKFEGIQFAGKPYIEMIQETPYIDIMDDPKQNYNVYLDKSNLHWFILFRKTDSTLPYVTFEISTLNMNDLLTVMKIMTDEDSKSLTRIGTYTGKLSKFCLMADRVRERMGRYQLLQSNCQHFCNNLAFQYGMSIHRPTGTFLLNVPAVTVTEKLPTETAPEEPQTTQVVCRRRSGSFRCAPVAVQKRAAKAVALITGVRGYDDIIHQVDGWSERLA